MTFQQEPASREWSRDPSWSGKNARRAPPGSAPSSVACQAFVLHLVPFPLRLNGVSGAERRLANAGIVVLAASASAATLLGVGAI